MVSLADMAAEIAKVKQELTTTLENFHAQKMLTELAQAKDEMKKEFEEYFKQKLEDQVQKVKEQFEEKERRKKTKNIRNRI